MATYAVIAKLTYTHTLQQLVATLIAVGLALSLTATGDKLYRMARHKALAAVMIQEDPASIERATSTSLSNEIARAEVLNSQNT